MTDSPIVAALDLGTNTIKLTVARTDGGSIEEFHGDSRVVRLGKAIGADDRIADEAFDRVLGALTELESVARKQGATVFIGVATQALRSAINGRDLLDRIAEETSWRLEVITGDEEARLTFEGLSRFLPESGTGVIVDIGGGSTEIVIANHREWRTAHSLLVGSGTLTDRYIVADPPATSEIVAARKEADRVLESFPQLSEASPDVLLLAGGAGQFLDALSHSFWNVPLSNGSINDLSTRFLHVNAAQIARAIDIPVERARVIPAGHQIALGAISLFAPGDIRAVPSGIRTGLLQRWAKAQAG